MKFLEFSPSGIVLIGMHPDEQPHEQAQSYVRCDHEPQHRLTEGLMNSRFRIVFGFWLWMGRVRGGFVPVGCRGTGRGGTVNHVPAGFTEFDESPKAEHRHNCNDDDL